MGDRTRGANVNSDQVDLCAQCGDLIQNGVCSVPWWCLHQFSENFAGDNYFRIWDVRICFLFVFGVSVLLLINVRKKNKKTGVKKIKIVKIVLKKL